MPWMACLAVLSFSLWNGLSYASTVAPVGNPLSTLSSGSVEVPVYEKVNLTVDGSTQSVPLFLSGDGIREETIIFDVPVYTATAYISTDPATLEASQDRDKTLSSILAAPTKLLQLTMLTDLTAIEVQTAFKDQLRTNGVDVTSGLVAQFLNKINFPFPTGMSINVVGYIRADGTQIVQVEVPNRPYIVSTDSTLSNDWWLVWFGKTDASDPNIGQLQDDLISQIFKGQSSRIF